MMAIENTLKNIWNSPGQDKKLTPAEQKALLESNRDQLEMADRFAQQNNHLSEAEVLELYGIPLKR